MTKTITAGRFAPSVLDAQAITFVDAFDSDPDPITGGGDHGRWAHKAYSPTLAPEAAERGWGRCTMCGAYLRYVVVLELDETGEKFLVGEDCAVNLQIAAEIGRKVSDLRKRAELGRENAKRIARREAYLQAHPEFAEAVKAYGERSSFIADVASKVGQYEISERQHDAVVRTAAKIAEADARKAAEAELPTAPVIEGRGVITGAVVSVKWVADHYDPYGGEVCKIVVRDDRGFKVWGTCPRAILETVTRADEDVRVTFTAAITKSDRDETFGFFKRPTKPQVLA